MTRDCEICGGSHVVRLPILPMVSASMSIGDIGQMDGASREYPCPECVGGAPYNRGEILYSTAILDSAITNPSYIRFWKQKAASMIADRLLGDGFLKFETGPVDKMTRRYPLRTTLMVVRPSDVATMEQRVTEMAGELAGEIVAEAERRILNWGSAYDNGWGSPIRKDVAIELVADALKIVLGKWQPLDETKGHQK